MIPGNTATIPEVGDIVEVHDGQPMNQGLNGNLRRWRVEAYVKSAPPPPPLDLAKDDLRTVLNRILYDTASRGPGERPMVWCEKEEAEYVVLGGVCGNRAKPADCRVVGRVGWSEDRINEQRESNRRFVGQLLH